MKKNKIVKHKPKYRIVKFSKTLNNNTEKYWFEIQKRGLLGRWKTVCERDMSFSFPMVFATFEEAEKVYEDKLLKPSVTVVKEYFK